MSCIYSDFDGKCTIWGPEIDGWGCNDEGYCICEDDPYPSYTCENYESREGDCEEPEFEGED